MIPALRKTLRGLAVILVAAALFLGTAGPYSRYPVSEGVAREVVAWGLVAIVGAIGFFVAAGFFLDYLNARVRLVEIVLLLPGEPYLGYLDALMAEADFATGWGRRKALQDLIERVRPGDIADGFVALRRKTASARAHAGPARALLREQKERAGRREETPGAEEGGGAACVLGIITTLGGWKRVSRQGPDAARDLLRWCALYTIPPFLLYLYRAPEPGRRLGPAEAKRLLEALRA